MLERDDFQDESGLIPSFRYNEQLLQAALINFRPKCAMRTAGAEFRRSTTSVSNTKILIFITVSRSIRSDQWRPVQIAVIGWQLFQWMLERIIHNDDTRSLDRKFFLFDRREIHDPHVEANYEKSSLI
jgi:hypothetical protein